MVKKMPHILVVDDDDRLRELLARYLGDQGFVVSTASHAKDAREKMACFVFDAVVLDVMMPGESGLDLIRTIDNRVPPILLLSAMGEPQDRIAGLEVGAQDYLTKPFEPRELVLRLCTMLRRNTEIKAARNVVRFGSCYFDIATSLLSCGGDAIYLTASESAILKILAKNAGAPVSREALTQMTASMQATGERSVDVHIARLRKKIGENEGKPTYIQTVRGAGYILHATLEG